jgi:hypothetical protein
MQKVEWNAKKSGNEVYVQPVAWAFRPCCEEIQKPSNEKNCIFIHKTARLTQKEKTMINRLRV